MAARALKFVGIGLWLCAMSIFASQPTQWFSRGIGAGGGMYSPSFSPYNGNEFYLACDMSELFHTTNGGAVWDTIDYRQLQAFHGTEVQFTSDPTVLYSVDYHQFGNGTFQQLPAKSLDGGGSWSRLSTASWPNGAAYRVVADPQSTNRLVASSFGSVYFSADGGNSFALVTGGATQTNRLSGAFFDGTNIFVACNAGLMVSTNNGSSFTNAAVGGFDANTTFFSFAGAKQGGVTRFYCVTTLTPFAQPDHDVVPSLTNRVYTLDWGQPNWLAVTNGFTTNDRPALVAMARSDVSVAYVATVKLNAQYPDVGSVFKTVNLGTNWNSVFTISNNLNIATGWGGVPVVGTLSYANPLGLAVDPNDANRLIRCDDALINMTTNGGVRWFPIYVNSADQNAPGTPVPQTKAYRGVGLEPTACWWINWADPTNMLADFSDLRMIRSKDGGASWSYDYSGMTVGDEVYQILPHPNTNLLYAINNTMVTPYGNLGLDDHTIDGSVGALYQSTNTGKAWAVVTNFGAAPMWLAIDPGNTNRAFVSTANSTNGAVWLTQNLLSGSSATWQKLSIPARANHHPYNLRVLNDGTLVCSFGAWYTNNFTPSAGVFVCTNVAAAAAGDVNAWVDRSATGMVYWMHDVVIDPNAAGQSNWYACVWNGFGISPGSGYNGGSPNNLGGLYKTTNRGLAWSRIFTNDSCTSCTINPGNANELYVCTRFSGLWLSTNINAATPAFQQLAEYPFREPTRVFFNPYNSSEVWVVSDGNGLRVGTIPVTPSPIEVWRYAHFGALTNNPSISGDLADPDADGLANLLEYGLNTDPLSNTATTNLPTETVEADGADDYLTLTVSRNPSATDVSFVVEVSGDLAAWHSGPSYTTTLIDLPTELKVRDNVPFASGTQRFIRLRITR